MPIVFTPTTLAGRFTLCCTYKTGLIDQDKARWIVERFLERLAGM
jgi:hypothetical protein